MVRRLVEEQEVGRHDPQQGQLQARALAAGEAPDLLERVVAAEQESGEVAPGLPCRHRDLGEQGVEHRLARDGVLADLGEVPEADVRPEGERAVAQRQVARDRPQERRLPGAVRTDDPDPLAPRRLQPDAARDLGTARMAHDEVVGAQDHLRGARRGRSQGAVEAE